MDNSLIPRPFSPTDAKREREANAREAERLASARTQSNGSIPIGGKTTITGDIDVSDGGDINLGSGGDINVAQGGAIKVAGTFKAGSASTVIEGVATLGTAADPITGAVSPGMFYTDPSSAKYGLRFKAGKTVLESSASSPPTPPARTQQLVDVSPAQGEFSAFANDLKVSSKFGYDWSEVRVTPSSVELFSTKGTGGTTSLVVSETGVKVNGAAIGGTPTLAHWEKSGTTSAPDSTVWGPGVVTSDPAVTTDAGLLTMVSQDVAQIRDTGIYAISFSMRFPSGVTATNTRSGASIEPMTGAAMAKGAVLQTDDQGTASIANVRLTAGQQFHFYIVQISGATRVMSYTIRVTKISN